jgi:putative ABC transport system substrate-binding protein
MGGPESGRTSGCLEALRQSLREQGWVEGQNLIIETRWAERPARDDVRALTAELVGRQVDVIVAQGPTVFGAQDGAGTVPVVFVFSGDPVEAKLVTSVARPGGTLTGLTL